MIRKIASWIYTPMFVLSVIAMYLEWILEQPSPKWLVFSFLACVPFFLWDLTKREEEWKSKNANK